MHDLHCRCPTCKRTKQRLIMKTSPYAIFFNGNLMGQSNGRTAQEAAANWINLRERTNPSYFDTNEVQITVGHYSSTRIQRLTTHKFRRSAWVVVQDQIL